MTNETNGPAASDETTRQNEMENASSVNTSEYNRPSSSRLDSETIGNLENSLVKLRRNLFHTVTLLRSRNKKDLDEIINNIVETDTKFTEITDDLAKKVNAIETELSAITEDMKKRLEIADIKLSAIAEDLGKRMEVLEDAQKPSSDEKSRIVNTWKNAPLVNRIQFMMDFLDQAHPLYPLLKKIKGLDELRLRGDSLFSWIKDYPEIFVDGALEALVMYPDISDCEVNGDFSILAYETLQETRKGFADYFRDHSLEWILPYPGERVTLEHKIVSKEESDLRKDSVARLLRPGFRIKGKLIIPANIAVAIPRETPSVNPEENKINIDNITSGPQPNQPAKAWPNWFKKLLQAKIGLESHHIDKWMNLLEELTNPSDISGREELLEVMHPLLPILKSQPIWGETEPPAQWIESFRETRLEIMDWLKDKLKVELIIPCLDDPFDESFMTAVSDRRTYNQVYDNKVAKVGKIGVKHGGEVLCKAEVVRYKKE